MKSEIATNSDGGRMLLIYLDKALEYDFANEIRDVVIQTYIKELTEKHRAEIQAQVDLKTLANMVNVGLAQELIRLTLNLATNKQETKN